MRQLMCYALSCCFCLREIFKHLGRMSEHLESILIISSKSQSIDGLTKLLMEEELLSPDSAKDAEHGRELALSRPYDLILVDSPLPDMKSEELAAYLSHNTDSCVLLFVGHEQELQVEKNMCEAGVFVIAKPVTRYVFHKSITYLRVSLNRLRGIRHEKVKLQKQNEEIRLVNRAKGILMEYLSMTESQAHRYLEKQAMDLRITKAEVAKSLLSTYEN